jgi:hypothetical protein
VGDFGSTGLAIVSAVIAAAAAGVAVWREVRATQNEDFARSSRTGSRPPIPSPAYQRSQWTIVSSGWRAAGLKSVPTV